MNNFSGFEIIILPNKKGELLNTFYSYSTNKEILFFRCKIKRISIKNGKTRTILGTLKASAPTINTYFKNWDYYEFNFIFNKIKEKLGNDTSKWIIKTKSMFITHLSQ